MITEGMLVDTLKATLEGIYTDVSDNIEEHYSVWKKWASDDKQDDAWVEYASIFMSGMASEKPEASPIPVATLGEGFITRFLLRTIGIMLIFSEELREDCKYPKAIDAARHNKRNLFRSMDIDITQMLMRAFNTAYTYADGVCLCSASHPLEGGAGVISNLMPDAVAPSVQALQDMINFASGMIGLDGVVEPLEIKSIVFPIQQRLKWSAILGSTMTPEAGNFAEINVLKKDFSIEQVPVPRWLSSTTQYVAMTDAEGGAMVKFKRRPRVKNWNDEDNTVVKHAITTRYARNWTNTARTVIGMDA